MTAVLLALGTALSAPQTVSAETAEHRDIIATAFDHPFITDAELEMYRSNTRGRVTCDTGFVLFRYPGISAVQVDGEPARGLQTEPDLLRVEFPADTHDVEIITDGEAEETDPSPGADGPEAVDTVEAFQAAGIDS